MQRQRRAKNVLMKQVLDRGRTDRREKEAKCGHCRRPKRRGWRRWTPKWVPSGGQDSLRWGQDGPRWGQNAPRCGQDARKLVQKLWPGQADSLFSQIQHQSWINSYQSCINPAKNFLPWRCSFALFRTIFVQSVQLRFTCSIFVQQRL